MIDSGIVAGRGGAARRTLASRALPLLAVVLALCGCQAPKDRPADAAATALPGGGGNVEAKLVGTGGSVASGSAVLHDVRGGVDIAIWLGSVGPGEFRVAIHETGNCSSRNGFAAGPPWAPPGVPLAVVTLAKNDDTRTLTGYLPGYRVQGPAGVAGRSVIVHASAIGSLEAQAGVPNNRIACGVIAPASSLF